MSNYTVKTFKWVSVDELSIKELLFEHLSEVWDFLGTDEGKFAEGIKVYDKDNVLIFALNHDVHLGPDHANSVKPVK